MLIWQNLGHHLDGNTIQNSRRNCQKEDLEGVGKMQTKQKPVLSGHSIKVKNRDARKSQLTCALLCFMYYLLVLQARTTPEALGSNYSKQTAPPHLPSELLIHTFGFSVCSARIVDPRHRFYWFLPAFICLYITGIHLQENYSKDKGNLALNH